MTPGKIDIVTPNGKFLWKYLDLHRFIYLLNEQLLFFTRLDKFEDPFEGVATRLLRHDAKYSKVPDKLEDFSDSIPKNKRRQLLNEKKLYDFLKRDNIQKAQNRQYINCWCNGDRESMAMWNLYSNSDSVAIRVGCENLVQEIKNSFEIFLVDNGNRASLIGNSVKYFKLNPFDESTPKNPVKYSSLKKDVSFEYEQEYRFLIYTIDNLDKIEAYYTLPIDLSRLSCTVICHPNMEKWKFKNIEKLIEISKAKIKIEKSATILKEKNYG